MGGNPFGLILSIGSVRIVVSFTCCDLRGAFFVRDDLHFRFLYVIWVKFGTKCGNG